MISIYFMSSHIKTIGSSMEPINDWKRKTWYLQLRNHRHRKRRRYKVLELLRTLGMNYYPFSSLLPFDLNLLGLDLIRKIRVSRVRSFPKVRGRALDILKGWKNGLVHPGIERSVVPDSFSHGFFVDSKVHGIDGVFGFPSHEGEIYMVYFVPFWEV